LLVYCWAQAVRQQVPQLADWKDPLGAWCRQMEAEVNRFTWPISGVPASRGASATAMAWAALAIHAASVPLAERRWAEMASGCFGRLAAGQQSSGALLRALSSDNPETLWYHELVLLHAMASYAAQSSDTLTTAAVMQAADFHLAETQPDHATAQPWALLAFIWRRESRPLADQVLHAQQTHQPDRPAGVTSMLLADCLYCLPKL
jgi:hypothetical protein